LSVGPATSLHVAFLRGVGGPKPAAGDELRACLGAASYDQVRPVMATGNVIFGLGRKRKPPEEGAISALIADHFGYPLPAILRPAAVVEKMVGDDPFHGVDQKRLTRFVALLAAEAPPGSAFPEPKRDAGYRLIDRRDRELLFVIDRDVVRTPDVMAKLERAFDKRLTTRNWNTMEKVAAVLAKERDAAGGSRA
jgi:uncharacterized protein (DUF1697 family)